MIGTVMGNIYQSTYTRKIPNDAVIKGNVVLWTSSRGKKHTGKLTTSGRVLIDTGKWVAEWTDERGFHHRESTGCTSKEMAQHFLRNKEIEVERIKAGIVSREEIMQSEQQHVPVTQHLDAFDTGRKAKAISTQQISEVRKKLNVIFDFMNVSNLREVNSDKIDEYIVFRKESGNATQTINNDLSALRSFFTWCIDTGRILQSPMRNKKQLSRAAGNKTEKRAFTEKELELLWTAVRGRRGVGKDFRQERELIYQTMLGTGLRSSELASIKVNQVTPTHIILESPNEKNRNGTYQPITEELSFLLTQWIESRDKRSNDFLFVFNKHSIFGYFERDCIKAGINRIDDRGHVLVVHSFRKTFGTRLARAGVPLTTTQRLMRHSSPELTAKYYIDVTPIEMAEALEKLPKILQEKR